MLDKWENYLSLFAKLNLYTLSIWIRIVWNKSIKEPGESGKTSFQIDRENQDYLFLDGGKGL